MICECCQKESAILQVGKWINEFDRRFFWLCKNCLRLPFSFYQKWNIKAQQWDFLALPE